MSLKVLLASVNGCEAPELAAAPDVVLTGVLQWPLENGGPGRLLADVILLDCGEQMPDPAMVRQLRLAAPAAALVLQGIWPRPEVRRQLLQSGTNDIIPAALGPEALSTALHAAHQRQREWLDALMSMAPEMLHPRGRTIAVFSTKGGTGKTTIATNLSLALALERGEPVCLLDLDLESGDAATFLGLNPPVTIADYAESGREAAGTVLERFLAPHPAGVRLLAAPARPEQADLVSPDDVRRLIQQARERFDWTVIDLAPVFRDQTLAALDAADQILLIMTPDLVAVRNARTALTAMTELGYTEDRIHLVLNRDGQPDGLLAAEIQPFFSRPLLLRLPDDPGTVVAALNRAEPFVLSHPRTQLARQMGRLARHCLPPSAHKTAAPQHWWCRWLGCVPARKMKEETS